MTAVDKYTVDVDTGKPLASLAVLETWMAKTPSGSSHWVASKKQSDEIGEDRLDFADSGWAHCSCSAPSPGLQ